MCCVFFFQAEDGIRDLVRSRGLGDVYKRQVKGRGHRKTIVNKDLAYVGVASGFHKIYKFVTVADFVELYQDYIK